MEGAAAAPGMGAGAAAAPGMGAGGSPSRKPLKATPAELAPVAEMLWGGPPVPDTQVARMLAATVLADGAAAAAIYTATDPLTQAYKTMVDYIDAAGKAAWKPTWGSVRLAVRVCQLNKKKEKEKKGKRNRRQASASASGAGGPSVCGIKVSHVDKKGAARYHPVVEVRPDSAAAEAGLTRGDVIVEVNGRVVVGQSVSYVTALLAAAWLGHQLQVTVLPASVARLILPTLAGALEARASYSRSPDPDTHSVVMGLIYIPSSASAEKPSSGARLKKLFGGSPTKPKPKTPDEVETMQEYRAKILRRGMQMLTNSNARFPAQEWFEVFRPALVTEYGAALIAENDEFLNEMISSMSMGRPDARPASEGPVTSPIERSYSADSFALETKRQEALEAADSAWKQEKSELENRIEESGPANVYAYADEQDELRQETLSAAERAWAAEKRRRRALGPGQQLGNTVTYMRDLALEQDDDAAVGPNKASPRRGDLGRAAQAHQRKQIEERQEQQRVHAEDALRAAEEAWQAEKARMVAKTAAATSTASSSIHMKRGSGGRVAPRRRALNDTEVPAARRNSGPMPEPNRPWFGGKGASGGSS